MSHVVIVRHGNTFEAGDPPRRIGRRTDLHLTATGQEQADRLGRWFDAREIHFSRMLAGALSRVRDTAEIIARHQSLGPSVETADWLSEIDHGPDEGEGEEDVVARIGDRALAEWDRYAVPPPGWIVDPPMRIAAWRRLFAETTDGVTLAVTSNGIARFALLALPSLTLPASLKLRTGAVAEFQRRPSGGWQLTCWDARP